MGGKVHGGLCQGPAVDAGSRASCMWPLASGGCPGYFHSTIVTEFPRTPSGPLRPRPQEVSGPHFCHILLVRVTTSPDGRG